MVVVFGSINLDLVFSVPRLPGSGETAVGPGYLRLPGGKGSNQALAAARAGSRVAMAGAVGVDDFARDALRLLREEGVDVERVGAVDAPTGCAAVCVDAAAENLIMVASGANALAAHACVEDALLVPDNVLVLQNEVPIAQSAALARRARERGTRVVWNAAPAEGIDRDALACVDVLVVNAHEAATLAARLGLDARACAPAACACALADALGLDVVLTLGAAGSVAATRGGRWLIRPLAVRAIDSTGAGDAFVGVLASALDRGLDEATAFAEAAVASGLACEQVGAQAALPRAAAIRDGLSRIAPVERRD